MKFISSDMIKQDLDNNVWSAHTGLYIDVTVSERAEENSSVVS